ncbi:MAG: TonB family protein [Xanthobacteraceae bacterium]|nr:TonB family protein [Xanthobacteraceae bacterium]
MTEFRPWPKVPMTMWTLAGLGAVAIHAGCVALALAFMDRAPDEGVGAPAVEIGIELWAPHTDTPDLPPGPDVEASIAAPQTIDQSAVAEQADLPRAVPMETEDPERLVAPIETEKPTDEPNMPAVPTVPSIESVAVEATAPPSSEMIEASTRSVTPVQGIGVTAQRARATWQKELIAHFNRHKRYPANRSAQAAEMLVGFELDDTGRVLSSSIVQGSGDVAFDDAALAMIRRSDPVPKPPEVVVHDGLSFTLPVIFRARHGG